MSLRSLLFKSIQNTKRLIKSSDIFARKIMFTYKGRDKFSTMIGGCTSIMIIITILVYLIILLNVMVNKNSTNIMFFVYLITPEITQIKLKVAKF